ncbi:MULTISPECIES: hypothetical protein [unclassified Streptomyces]
MDQILRLQELTSDIEGAEEGAVEISTPSVILCSPPSFTTAH